MYNEKDLHKVLYQLEAGVSGLYLTSSLQRPMLRIMN
jgi:hypothetical protein